MLFRSFQAKLLTLLIAALLLLQAATLIAVHVAGQQTLRHRLSQELQVGGRVLDRILATRGRQLSDSVRVLAADFAFREAVASGDQATITSVLSNHGSRISANAVFLIGLDRKVIADTRGGRLVGREFPLRALIDDAESGAEASAIVSLDNRPYQLVAVPVLAPQPIAWICMGFAIDEGLLDDMRRLTSLELSLWTATPRQQPVLLSTLSAENRAELLRQERVMRGSEHEELVTLGSEEYETLSKPLTTADGSHITALLQRSVAEANRPYALLELRIFALSGLALALALIAAIVFARGVSQPLQRLAEGAEQIERGNYATAVDVAQHDEIGTLATAFNKMRTAIADREEQIRYQSTHDVLTGLPNRTLFLDRLSQAITAAQRSGESVGLIVMDVDRFKEINDTLGHQFGDGLLNEIGRRLSHTLRASDTVARLGGDEYGVMFVASDPSRADEVATRITTALDTPITLGNVSVSVAASMGIALYPVHAEDPGTLMKRADIAMYDAKKSHAASAVYEPGRDEHSLRRLSILSELRHAIARDELTVHYQPKIDIATSRAIHAEALVRWHHPTYGRIAPDEFIPLAEQSGQIGAITKWMLRRAITQCAQWSASGLDLCVAVNLSALDLYDSELPTFISGLLGDAGLPGSKLLLEITESAVMKDPTFAVRILTELKRRGVSLAIDDFGTGYSSLAHLKRLPVDELKIDKSFVVNLSNSAHDDMVIVRSTIELGHNMGLKVIAEGVENAEALSALGTLGCDMAQGYFVSRPLPADEFARWMRESMWAGGKPAVTRN
jgi:diguanylate cyclase (GGDEF)-like protein